MVNLSSEMPQQIIENMFDLVRILEALGILIFGYILFSIINTIINRKRMKEIVQINKNLNDIKKLLSKKK